MRAVIQPNLLNSTCRKGKEQNLKTIERLKAINQGTNDELIESTITKFTLEQIELENE